MVLQVINNIPFVYFLPFKVPLKTFTFDVSMVLNGTERYRTVLNGIEWYLNGIPLADFDEIFYY